MKPPRTKRIPKAEESDTPPDLVHVIKDTGKEIGKVIGIAGLLIALVTAASLSAAATRLLHEFTKAFQNEETRNLWYYFKLTAPLTLAIGLLAVSVIRDWFGGGVGQIFAFTAALALTTFLLQPEGVSMLSLVAHAHVSSPYGYTINLVLEYLKLYWWQAFVCSLIIGGALGYLTHRIMERIKMIG